MSQIRAQNHCKLRVFYNEPDADAEQDHEGGDDDLLEEGVECLHMDEHSDVEEQFVLSFETCLPEDSVEDMHDFHLN